MASFLQNNGDIILDAVLTDYGRKLLARGDGSFNIVKFAFGDDEIDYGLYDNDAESINKDIEIMNTPILEAITNNIVSMKYQLLTLTSENMLFLPVVKLNYGIEASKTGSFGDPTIFSGYVSPVDSLKNKTIDALSSSGPIPGVTMPGVLINKTNGTQRYITLDQGLDSQKLDPYKSLAQVDPMLYESEYNIYVDNHYCYVASMAGERLSPLGVDDDGIAVYRVSEQSVVNNTSYVNQIITDPYQTSDSVIAGTKGSRLQFTIMPNNNLISSDHYFNEYGKELALNPDQPTVLFKTLKMPVKVVGVSTGYSVDISVLFAKVIPTGNYY